MPTTIKEAIELISTNCMFAALAGTTHENFMEMDDDAKTELATWLADWLDGKFRQ